MLYQNQPGSLPVSIVIFLLLNAASAAAQLTTSLSSNAISAVSVKKNFKEDESADPKKNISAKIDALKRDLLSAPGDAVLYNNLGAAYALLKNYDEAVSALEKATALRADFFNAFYNLGIVYDNLGRYSDALTTIQKAVALDATSVAARTEMCQLYLASKKFTEAVPCYEALLEMNARGIRVRANYGIALLKAKQFEKALAVLRENTELFPNEALTHNALGMLLFEKKKYRQAADCFNRAIEVNPRFEPARFNLALVELARNDRGAALKQYSLLKNSNPGYAAALYKFLYRDKIVYANQ
ncbi:MAG TPA: tetratricopeptide repeat protein [Pyrinomonadaceae bacterium]|jgi:tetratricopeptide (TPR) repeat protein